MIARHPFAFSALVMFGAGTILFAIGIALEWSDGALGAAAIGAVVLGTVARVLADVRAPR